MTKTSSRGYNLFHGAVICVSSKHSGQIGYLPGQTKRQLSSKLGGYIFAATLVFCGVENSPTVLISKLKSRSGDTHHQLFHGAVICVSP